MCCYLGALDWFGRYYTVDELFDEVNEGREVLLGLPGEASRSAGEEPTLSPSSCGASSRSAETGTSHTALDTCLYTAERRGAQGLEEADCSCATSRAWTPFSTRRALGSPTA